MGVALTYPLPVKEVKMIINNYKGERGAVHYKCRCDNCKQIFLYPPYHNPIDFKHHFCCKKCKTEFYRGDNIKQIIIKIANSLRGKYTKEKSSNWRGGKTTHTNGYILIFKPEHINCNQRGYVYEHRLIMENHIGRLLESKEIVHHLNENKIDNRIENLILFNNAAEHLRFHKSNKAGGV